MSIHTGDPIDFLLSQRDRELQERLSYEQNQPVPFPLSDEVYLLQKFRWLILTNQSNIRYHADSRMDSHFHALMNTYDYEDALFRIYSDLKDYRNLKELYIQFNSRNRFLYAARSAPVLNGVAVYNPSVYFEDDLCY
ncbi:MAG: hypothetical protein K2H52_12600 [Lachnospiraceae bacterium]|nr:hypothetical protein [Lachnospiraceae bacterium]MDE6186461.1 hypothetical protein [Lachnospiraceae bacterium]